MVGRGLRKSIGKTDCHVIDMVASLENGIVTTPTLLGLDPHEILENADTETAKNLKERKGREREREQHAVDSPAAPTPAYTGKITFTHYDDVNSLIENTSGEQHIRGMSHFAWVQVNNNRYILSSSTGTFLTLKVLERECHVILTRKLPQSESKTDKRSRVPYMRPVQIATTASFSDAVHAADTYAREKFPVPFILTRAPWRRTPATPEQMAFLNKFREEEKKLEVGSIAKGKAADFITKLKHGARGELKRMGAEKAKAERVQEKDEREQEMQRRAVVKVGPVES